MQFFDGLEDVGTESAQVDACLSGHGCHVNLYRTTLHDDGKVAVAAYLRFKRERIFLPLFARLAKRLPCHELTVCIAQSYYQFAFAFGINRTNILFT